MPLGREQQHWAASKCLHGSGAVQRQQGGFGGVAQEGTLGLVCALLIACRPRQLLHHGMLSSSTKFHSISISMICCIQHVFLRPCSRLLLLQFLTPSLCVTAAPHNLGHVTGTTIWVHRVPERWNLKKTGHTSPACTLSASLCSARDSSSVIAAPAATVAAHCRLCCHSGTDSTAARCAFAAAADRAAASCTAAAAAACELSTYVKSVTYPYCCTVEPRGILVYASRHGPRNHNHT